MSAPIALFTNCCCGKGNDSTGKLNRVGYALFLGLPIADALVSITALVVGILGLCGIIHGMPPAASWALVGISCTISILWAAMGCKVLYNNLVSKKPMTTVDAV